MLISKPKKDYSFLSSTQHYNESGSLLITIDNVLNEVECESIIDRCKRIGFTLASMYSRFGVEKYMTDIRNSGRVIIDSQDFVDNLLPRIKHIIPNIYKSKKFLSINPRLRILKYNEGEYFKRHEDGNYSNSVSKSLITVLIYLNCDYEGAWTIVYNNDKDKIGTAIEPLLGSILLLDQEIEHEVKPLKSGTKYVLRTELMYEK